MQSQPRTHHVARRRIASLSGTALLAAVTVGGIDPADASPTAPVSSSKPAASTAASMPVPQTQYSIIDSDSESPAYPAPPSLDGTAKAAIDGDYETEWTSAYSGNASAPMPHHLTIDTGKSYRMTGLQYSVKPGNGQVANYEAYVTDDAAVAKDSTSRGWGSPVARGTFTAATSATQQQTVTFETPASGRYVKFVALSAHGGGDVAAASEIHVLAQGTYSDPLYNVTTTGLGPSSIVDDTPASPLIDKDGTYDVETAHALYGANDPRAWKFYTGADFDHLTPDATRNNATDPSNPKDSNADTTERCNTSPTGKEATNAPSGSGYAQRNYCDLTQLWVDPDSGTWYGLVHNEFTPRPFGDGLHYDSIDVARSTDQGKTWTIVDHVITSPYSTTRGDTTAFPQQTYSYGDGDPRLYVDTASGYFYVYYGSRVVNKGGSWVNFYEHAARAPISGKMAKGTWAKYYDGAWSQPGIGGKESNLVPVGAGNTTGYTPVDEEYNPKNPGSASQQVVNGTAPRTSPLFVMDITYNAYLGLYVGEPQNPNQSGKEPQQFYATKSLSDPKWFLLGDSGSSYLTASWYRWFLDGANATNSAIVGKSFRSYCGFACNNGSQQQYANITIDTNAPAAPVTSGRSYRITADRNAALTQTPGSNSVTAKTKGNKELALWTFVAQGDGSYVIKNHKTGNLLGVDSSSNRGRAWGAEPTATPAAGTSPTVGQQWWIVPNVDSRTGQADGTVRLVNRYSGLVLGMDGASADVATTPGRTWDAPKKSGNSMPLVGEQVIRLRD